MFLQWIKCSERLPLNEEECFVAVQFLPIDEDSFVFSLAIFNNGEFRSWEIGHLLTYVSHWMPLPDPPEE